MFTLKALPIFLGKLRKPCSTFNHPIIKFFLTKNTFLRSISFAPILFDSAEEFDSFLNESHFDEETRRLYLHPGAGHNVLLLQPRLSDGPDYEKKPISELKMAEAEALVKTLHRWRVAEKHIVPVGSLKSNQFFGSGNLEKLVTIVHQNPAITAVFVGIDILTAAQNSKLEEAFKVQIFDRYQVILKIFHDHAHTREAKLQLAMAEIPYLRVKLSVFHHSGYSSKFDEMHHVGGSGETFMEVRRRLLNQRELKLKKALEKIRNQRQFIRQSDTRKSHPIVAVVGYTNCGKTTLIKSLTNDEKLTPEDKLFATLDVTLHPGVLPSSQKVLYIDTVGFISDVPTNLIQSFRSTLEEITLADLVIHVRDISHPDAESQKKTVLKTLQSLGLSPKLLDTIVEVRNKIDLVDKSKLEESTGEICISATEGTGLPGLLKTVEQKIFENTEMCATLLRIPNGGAEYNWLLKEATIRDAIADRIDSNYLIVEVVISSQNMAKFKHRFGNMTIKLEAVMKQLE